MKKATLLFTLLLLFTLNILAQTDCAQMNYPDEGTASFTNGGGTYDYPIGLGQHKNQVYIFNWDSADFADNTINEGDSQTFTLPDGTIVVATFTNVRTEFYDRDKSTTPYTFTLTSTQTGTSSSYTRIKDIQTFNGSATKLGALIGRMYNPNGKNNGDRETFLFKKTYSDNTFIKVYFTLNLTATKNGQTCPLNVIPMEAESMNPNETRDGYQFTTDGGGFIHLEDFTSTYPPTDPANQTPVAISYPANATGAGTQTLTILNTLDNTNNTGGNSLYYAPSTTQLDVVIDHLGNGSPGAVAFGLYVDCPEVTGALQPREYLGCATTDAPVANSLLDLQAMGLIVTGFTGNTKSVTITHEDTAPQGTCPQEFTRTYTIGNLCTGVITKTQTIYLKQQILKPCETQSILDWDSQTWTAGSMSNTYTIDGVDIGINIDDPNNAVIRTGRNYTLPNGQMIVLPPTPVLGEFYQGDLATAGSEKTLIIYTNLTKMPDNNIVTIGTDIGKSGTGVTGVNFKIFDADGELGKFLRQEKYVIKGYLNGVEVQPVLNGAIAHAITGNETLGMVPVNDIEGNSEDAVLEVYFPQAVDHFEIEFSIINGVPPSPTSTPGFGIYDISFCPPNYEEITCISEATAPETIPTLTDNCGNTYNNPVLTIKDSPDPLVCEGTRIYEYNYLDACNVTATWSYEYKINKNEDAPEITGTISETIVEGCAVSEAPAAATDVTSLETLGVTVSDCTATASLTVTYDDVVSNTSSCEILVTRTYSVTDTCDNTATVVHTIKIQDTTAPEITGTISETIVDGCVTGTAPAAATNVLELEALGVTVSDCSASASITVTSTDVESGTCPLIITRTYSLTDACSNTATIVHTIKIGDATPPEITGTISDTTVEGCDVGSVPAAVTDVAGLEDLGLTVSDCTVSSSIIVDYADVESGSCPLIITRTYSVTDSCDNTATVVHTITIEDTTPPKITGTISDTTVEGCDLGSAPAAVTTITALKALGLTFSDCSVTASLTVTYNDVVSNTSSCEILVARTYSVTDSCDNTATVVHTIKIQDTTPPLITGTLPSFTVEGCNANDAPAGITEISGLEALGVTISDCSATASITVTYTDEASGICPVVVNRTYFVTDLCSNTASITQTFEIENGIVLPCETQSTLDWDAVEWAYGSRSNTYTVDDVKLGFNIIDNGGAIINVETPTPSNYPNVPPAPGKGYFYQGDLPISAFGDNTLIFATYLDKMPDDNNVTISVDVGESGVGANGVNFKIFDVDGEIGKFLRQEKYVIKGYLDGQEVMPVLYGTQNHLINNNEVLGLYPSTPAGVVADYLGHPHNYADGVLKVYFPSPVDKFDIIFSIVNGVAPNPGSKPGFGIYDINFCDAPVETVSCISEIEEPVAPVLKDACGNDVSAIGPVVTNDPDPLTCGGIRNYEYTYTNCAGVESKWVYTYELEAGTLSVTANADATEVCEGTSVTLTGSGGTSSTTYTWDNGVTDGIAFVPPVGTTVYTLTGTDECKNCTATDTLTIIVNPKPVVTVTQPASVCYPETIDLTSLVSSTTAGTYNYYTNAALTQIVSNPTAIADTGVYYIVLADDTTGCESEMVSVSLIINLCNASTEAVDDFNTTDINTPVSGNVLDNDSDPEGDAQTVTDNTQPANGTVTVNPDGSYIYSPNADFTGVDTFVYTVCDDGTPQACAQAVVSITVNPLEDPCETDKTPTPELSIVGANCTNSATVTISNYDASVTYILSDGLMHTGSVIEGFELGNTYSISAIKNNCESEVVAFTVPDSANLDCDDDGVTKDEDPDDNDACVPNKTATPELDVVQATFTSSAIVTISNYDTSATYVLSDGLTHTNSVIEGFELGNTYSISAVKNNCESDAVEFILLNLSNYDNDGDGVPNDKDTDDNNPCVPYQTATPELSVVQADCTNSATVTISNYDASVTYVLSDGLTHTGSVIEGFELGNTYSISATKDSCESDSVVFTLVDTANLDCDGDGVVKGKDPDDNDACIPNKTATPELSVVQADCTNTATVTISNYDASVTYVLSDGLTHTGSVIEGFELGNTYRISAIKNNCESDVTPFTLSIVDQSKCYDCNSLYTKLKNRDFTQLISPNNDGKNDVWNLEDLKVYSINCVKGNEKNKIIIFNRWGAKVYEKVNYMLDGERFEGKSDNSLDYKDDRVLPAGTYFYILEVGSTIEKTGYIYIVVE